MNNTNYELYISVLSTLQNIGDWDLIELKEYCKIITMEDFISIIDEAIHDKEVMEQ